MSASTCINTWDDVWAEFDARQARDSAKTAPESKVAGATGTLRTATSTRRECATTRLNRLIHAQRSRTLTIHHAAPAKAAGSSRGEAEHVPVLPARKRPEPRGLGRIKRTVALMACTLIAVYVGSPVASAVQVAAAIQRGDAAALAHYIDWNTLRPALNAALAAETQRNDSQPMPDFITGMTQDMAERLASPAGLALLLNERLAAGGTQPARDMLSRVRVLEAGLWEVTLTSINVPDRSATLTLALTDVARLRWEVQAIQLPPQRPSQLPLRFR